MSEPGVCSVCGCSQYDPCPQGCVWANSTATLCSRCATGGSLIADCYPSPEMLATSDELEEDEMLAAFAELDDLDELGDFGGYEP